MIPFAIQVLSRNNDTKGNPYRLIIVYDNELNVIKVVECRSFISSYLHLDKIKKCKFLRSFHLNPSEYNDTRKYYQQIGVWEREV